MNHRGLFHELERVARRIRLTRLWSALAVNWLVWALLSIGIIVVLWPGGTIQVSTIAALGVGAIVGALLCTWLTVRSARDHQKIARRVEARYPELNARVLAAIEQEPEFAQGRYGFLQETVIRETLSHARKHPWSETVSERRLWLAQVASVISLALLVVVIGGPAAL